MVVAGAEPQLVAAHGILFGQVHPAVGATHHLRVLDAARRVLLEFPFTVHAVELEAGPEQHREDDQADEQEIHSLGSPMTARGALHAPALAGQ